MKPLLNRAHFHPVPLAVALAAFALNLIFVLPRAAPPAPCESESAAVVPTREAAARTPQTTPAQTHTPVTEAANVEPARIAQQEVVRMPGVGRVTVTAYEDEEATRLVFDDAATGKELAAVKMASDSFKPKLRFRVLHVKGLPDPLVVGLAVSPGGSDSGWEAVAFGAVGGELRDVTGFEGLQTGDRGGFHFGDLGGGIGPGVAVWSDVWDTEYEGHPSPHRYEVKLYSWNKVNKRFEWHKVFRTRGKFDTGDDALRSAGLRFRDVRRGVRDFSYLAEEYGPRSGAL